jgi:O-antigen/teichoic acid export membrane protein
MGVSILLGLLITPIIINTLGKELYGLWGLAASFVGFYGLFDFGLSSAVARFLGNAIGARDIRQFNRVASTGKCLLSGTSLLVIIFAIVIMGPAQLILRIPDQYTTQFRLLIVLSAASMAITISTSIYGGGLLASEDFVPLSCINIVTAIARSIGGLGAVLAGRGVIGLAVVNVIVSALGQFIIFLRCKIRFPQLKASFSNFDTVIARVLLGFSAATFVVMIAALVRSKLDVMLVTRFGGLSQAGVYTVAVTVFTYVFTAIGAVFGVTWPRLNKLQGTSNLVELQRFFRRASHITAASASLLSGLVIGLAPLLIRLWLGHGYEESATVLRILTAGYLLDFATNPGIGSLYATAHHRYFAAQTTIEAIASFALAAILGIKFGMKGVALGIVIPITVVKLTVQPWYVTRNLSIGLGRYWFRNVAMASAATAALSIGLAHVDYGIARWGWWAAPALIMAAMVVPLGIVWVLLLDRTDRAYILSLIQQTINKVTNKVRVLSTSQSESNDAR